MTLTESILTTKILRLQTEYMDTRKTRITLHGVPMYNPENHLEDFSDYEPVEWVSSIKSQPVLPAVSLKSWEH